MCFQEVGKAVDHCGIMDRVANVMEIVRGVVDEGR